jgi:hypothetical protein
MTLREKKRFIRSLMESVFKEMREKVAAMPEEWDGLELRELIADKFDRERHMSMPHRRREYRRRLNDYQNETAVRNL